MADHTSLSFCSSVVSKWLKRQLSCCLEDDSTCLSHFAWASSVYLLLYVCAGVNMMRTQLTLPDFPWRSKFYMRLLISPTIDRMHVRVICVCLNACRPHSLESLANHSSSVGC